MVLEPVDPNARFRERRYRARRRRKLQLSAFLGALVLSAIGGGLIVWFTGDRAGRAAETVKTSAIQQESAPRISVPKEIRGIHVTMGLAGVPGKLDEYLRLTEEGLNTIELDIKDENGAVAFASQNAPLVNEIGADGGFYDPKQVADRIHASDVYLIGRVVTFEDPVLSERKPDLAILRTDGSPWLTSAGLGWTNEYDKRVWEYNVSIAKAAALAGFDEIQFDYVRFPSDGDVSNAVWPRRRNEPQAVTIARFMKYAASQLKPLGVRVSIDVFGLAATRDLGIGQSPKRLAPLVDAISPMVYPSHFGNGEYGLPDPQAVPGTTVGYALSDFSGQMAGKRAELVPWIQDFSMGRHYTLSDIQDQILAVRRARARGYLLWNPSGIYTRGALQPANGAVVFSD